MKFTINRYHFVHALQQVCNIIGARTITPILANVLIIANKNSITLTTTNLDLSIQCQCEAKVENLGEITLPARKLITIIRLLPDLEVLISMTKSGQVKIVSANSRFKIMSIGKDEFPKLSFFCKNEKIELKQIDLQKMLKYVSYAQSINESRKILNGIFLKIKDKKVTLVATDGKRLALKSQENNFIYNYSSNIVIPARTVIELQRLLGQGQFVRIQYTNYQVKFDIDVDKTAKDQGLESYISLISKIIEGEYPDFQKVIPGQQKYSIEIERELLKDCLQRVALITDEQYNSVNFEFKNNILEIQGLNPKIGESYESIAINYKGPKLRIAFNPQYILEPLKSLSDDKIYFEFKDELSPGAIKTLDKFLCVVMPLRISNEISSGNN